MAVKSKKTVPFEAGGKPYVLCFSVNACAAFERVSGLKGVEISKVFGENGEDFAFGRLVEVFWAGLTDGHEGITQRQAGIIIEEIGIREATRLVGEAFRKAFGGIEVDPDASARGGDAVGNAQAAAG